MYPLQFTLTNPKHLPTPAGIIRTTTMNITINTPRQVFRTIGHTEKFEPVLFWKIGQRKQALRDLTDYLDEYGKMIQVCYKAGVTLTEEEERRIAGEFHASAKRQAEEILERCVIYKDRFFTFLPVQTR